MKSPEAFEKHLAEKGAFDISFGVSQERIRAYQQSLFDGATREDAFAQAVDGLKLSSIEMAYARRTLENLPGPEDI